MTQESFRPGSGDETDYVAEKFTSTLWEGCQTHWDLNGLLTGKRAKTTDGQEGVIHSVYLHVDKKEGRSCIRIGLDLAGRLKFFDPDELQIVKERPALVTGLLRIFKRN